MSGLIRGKAVSKSSMIFASMVAIVYNGYKIFKTGNAPSLEEQKSILLLCAALIAFFSPVYLSIWLEKIFGKKE
ncbi:MAG: hypothetical protein JXB50_16870 [Spirochaetes bacterium]|nr:hypothetical protein [Spirochaetota bacterium]